MERLKYCWPIVWRIHQLPIVSYCNDEDIWCFLSRWPEKVANPHTSCRWFWNDLTLICGRDLSYDITKNVGRFMQVLLYLHYDDVIMGVMASQITSLTIVYSTVY